MRIGSKASNRLENDAARCSVALNTDRRQELRNETNFHANALPHFLINLDKEFSRTDDTRAGKSRRLDDVRRPFATVGPSFQLSLNS